MYVQVPRVSLGRTSENAYGTLDIADIPELEPWEEMLMILLIC
mgnify:CR=1 FL=1